MPVILSDHRIAYFAVPKVASSSIKLALYNVQEGPDAQRFTDPDREVHYVMRTAPFRRRDWEDYDGYWKFVVVRDPVKRLLSAFGNRIVHHRDETRGRLNGARRMILSLPRAPKADDFFPRLRRYMFASGALRHHFQPLSNYIGPDLSKYDAVYPIERLADLERDLSERLGQPIEFPRLQTTGPKLRFADVSRRAARALLEHSRRDYELLADYYAPPKLETSGGKPDVGEPDPAHA